MEFKTTSLLVSKLPLWRSRRSVIIYVIFVCLFMASGLIVFYLLPFFNAQNALPDVKGSHEEPFLTPTVTTKPPSTENISPFWEGARQAIVIPHLDTPLIAHGNETLPEIALTFDDGPFPVYTEQILAVLAKYHIKATFFSLGQQVAAYPELTSKVYQAGCEVENHTWNHPSLPSLSVSAQTWQVTNTNTTIETTIKQAPIVVRPPYGAYNQPFLSMVHNMNMATVIWNVDSEDWKRPGVDAIVQRVLTTVKNGSIILMHDGGGDRSQTVAALPKIIEALQKRGYRFVTIRKMLAQTV